MKTLMRRHILLLTFLALFGCAYRTSIYSPTAMTPNDHPQGSGIFIYRDSLKGDIWLQEGKDSTFVLFVFSTINEPATFLTDNFYIESANANFKITAPVKFLSNLHESEGVNTLEIHQGKILKLEFPKDIQALSSFVLHLPPITTSNKQTVPNLDAITFKKEKVWRAITIN